MCIPPIVSRAQFDGIDMELFCCSRCEWWCEHSEEAISSQKVPDPEGPYCSDHEENPDDEDPDDEERD